ncbi:MAG: TonB-dependent receptor [Tenuifilaceae bacterium]|jgi:TonB-linked SusC/RagA family outer membrane protein|nr:TonB-dependent receptor [Tenuifilaceae bacterium]
MKINFFSLSIIVALSLLSSIAQAQPHSISGIVKDAETGEGIIGVTVVEQGTTTGTTTDLDGAFSFTISNPTATLDVSFVGYKSVSVPVNSRAFIEIVLLVDMMELDEVVVIGYGVQKKKVVTGAISSVSAEEISATPVLRIDQAMQGRTAGVQITNLSGQPGEAPTVRVRGAGTTGNSEPLYIVDGMAVGGIDYLNPGDIESIDVLKDAASAAIYGARAANGVVLITTKGAKKGDMSVTYSGYYGIQNVSRTIDMLNADQYRELMNEGARNSDQSEPFDLNEIPKHNTNWQDHLFQSNAPMTNHELSVTGGTDKSSYASSMSYFSQQGIIGGEKSQFDRITGRLNSRHQVTTKFQFGSNLSYSHIVRRGIASNQSFNGAYSSALNLDPLTPLYETDANVLATDPYASEPVVTTADGKIYGISELLKGGEVINPLALLELENAETRVDKVVGNIFGDLEIIEGLNLRTSLGIDLAYVLNDSYRPLFYLNGAQLNVDKTSVQKHIDRYFTWQWENTLSYAKQIEDHSFTGLLGMTASKSNFEDLFGFNAKVPINDPRHVYLNMATDTVWNALGGAAHSALLSGFARVTYDYKSRYAFTGIIRRDGSSKFGPNQRYGIFPSLGVSWVVSDEEFFPEVDQISFVKLRASWGVNGNQEIGNYQFISVMDKSRGYIFGNGREFGASPAYIENNDIHWEESEQLDIALDFGAYNNRLTATIDYYIKTTSGLLERIPIPAHVGNDPPVANVGSVQNKGVELSINWRHYFNDFGYSVGINGAYNQNKMTKIGNDEGVLSGATWAVAGMVTRTELGLPIAYFWGFKTDGIFQSQAEVFQHIGKTGQVLQPNAKPGDVRFVDSNNDGVLNENDRTMIGNPTPPLTFGMNASIDYKRFDFSVLLIGSYGNDVFNGAQRQDLRYTNRSTAILDRWTPENPSTTTPRYTWDDVNYNYRVSDLYVEDGSFVKVKNVQLGYTLPEVLLNRMSSRTWRFYVSVENLFTFTKYTGADPEIGAMNSFDIGIDRGIYPQARTIRFGTSMTF